MSLEAKNIRICVCDVDLFKKAEERKKRFNILNAKSDNVQFKQFLTPDDLANKLDVIYFVHVSENEAILEYLEKEKPLDRNRILIMSGIIHSTNKRRKILNDYLADKITADQLSAFTIKELKYNMCDANSKNIIELISPLIISLQFYCAIDGDNNEWFYWGNYERPEWLPVGIKNAKSQNYLVPCPLKNAFMLVKEAQWDYYASLLNITLPLNEYNEYDTSYATISKEEEQNYLADNKLCVLLDKYLQHLDKKNGLEDLVLALSEHSDENKIFYELKIDNKVHKITFSVFVRKMRELTAILANTVERTSAGNVYCYKGKNYDTRDEIIKSLFSYELYQEKDMRHSKLESEPELYNNLVQQLDFWLETDQGINYFIVIEGLTRMIALLKESAND